MSKGYTILFNGKELPDFIKVKSVSFQVLPAVNHQFLHIGSTGGVKTAAVNLGGKVFDVEVVLVKEHGRSLTELGIELSLWCAGNDFRLSKLIFTDDIAVAYDAVVTNNVEINDLLYAGEGTIQFTVPSGIANRVEPTTVSSINGRANINYTGTAVAYPEITFYPNTDRINESVAFYSVANGTRVVITGDFIAGNPVVINCDKKVVSIGNSIALKMIQLETDWIYLQSGTHDTIVCSSNFGSFSVYYKENYI